MKHGTGFFTRQENWLYAKLGAEPEQHNFSGISTFMGKLYFIRIVVFVSDLVDFGLRKDHVYSGVSCGLP